VIGGPPSDHTGVAWRSGKMAVQGLAVALDTESKSIRKVMGYTFL
jgi:hypothetical protein